MADLNICRVCLVHSNNETLFSIFNYSKNTASEIFILTGVQIVEFKGYDVPALICESCLRDLKNAMKFRNRAKQSDLFFRNYSAEVEELHWNKKFTLVDEFESEPIFEEFLEVKQDQENKQIIKFEEEHLESSEDEAFTVEMLEDDIIEEDTTKSNKDDPNLVCSYCQMRLATPQTLNNHLKIKHNHNVTEFFSCASCNRNFPLEKSYKRHMREVHGEAKSTTCTICNKIFVSERRLLVHLDAEHLEEGQEFKCDQCPKSFPTRVKHRKHVHEAHVYKRPRAPPKVKQEGGDPHIYGPCSTCGKFLTSSSSLKNHEKIHIVLSPDDYYYCDMCGNKFKQKKQVSAHIIKRHVQKIRYPCPDCPGRHFSTKYSLNHHIKFVHQNIRNFRCEICGKGFGQRDKLNAHIRIHTGEKPFHCKFCDKRYTHQTDYIRHTWSHTGERRFTCRFCKQGYKEKGDLEAHDCPYKLQT